MSNILKGLTESNYRNYDNNRTGFSRGQRDDERHDLDVQQPSQQQWALKINGKVWSKDGKAVTFNSREQALKARLSLLAKRPELEVGLVTRGGVAEAGTGLDIDRSIPGRTIARVSDKANTLSSKAKTLPSFMDRDDYDPWSGKIGASIHDDEEDTFDTDYTGDEDGTLKEISNEKLAQYKTAAALDAGKADSEGDYKRGDKRFSGIVKATKKQFANDTKKSNVAQGMDEADEKSADPFKTTYPRINNPKILGTNNKAKSIYYPPSKPNVKKLDKPLPESLGDELKSKSLDALQQVKQQLEKQRMADLEQWEKDFKQNTVSKFTARQPSFMRQEPTQVAQPKEKHSVLKARLVQLDNAIQKQAVLDKMLHRLEAKGLLTPAMQADTDTSMLVRDGAKDNYVSLNQKLDKALELIKTRLMTNKAAFSKSKTLDENDELDENLHKWFQEKWVRFGPDGKIRGDCARGDDSEGKPKCLPQSKAHSLGKKGRASAASRKRREDPNPERSGKAINVNTKKKSNEGVAEGSIGDKIKGAAKSVKRATHGWGVGGAPDMVTPKGVVQAFGNMDGQRLANFVASRKELSKPGKDSARAFADKVIDREMKQRGYGRIADKDEQGVTEEQLDELSCWSGYHRVAGTKAGFPGSCAKNKTNESEHSETCPHCGGEMVSEELMNEKKDACYYKVKSRYKVWPSAYASGALVKCRKKGASNWGNGGKSNESVAEDDAGDVEQRFAVKMEKEKQRLAKLKQTDPEAYKREMEKHKQTNRIPPVSTFEDQGVAEDQLDEKWTKKYKDSINCSNPKGFSQKAHCAGKQKNESAIMSGLNQLDEGWKEKLGAAALAGSMALGAGAAHSRVTPDGQGGFTGGLKPSATVTAPADNKPAAEAPKGFSKEYLQKAADPNRTGRYMISVEKAQELLKNMP